MTLSSPATGTLRDPNAASDGSGVSNGTYTVTGTAAQITADIDALVFTPAAGQYGTENFTIQATNIAGVSAMDGTTSVVVPGVPSTIANTQPAAQTSDETALFPFAGVAVTDADIGATDTLTVTPSAANGTLTATAGGTVAANGAFSVSGTASQVTSALIPTAHQVSPGQTVTTTFSLSDTNTALPASAATASETVTATAVNDPPAIRGTHATQTSGTAAVTPFTAVAITDPDTGVQDSLVITLSGAGGTLSGAGLTGSGSGYSLAATNPATLSAELDALSFTPSAVGTTSFTLQASQTAGGTTASTSDMNTTVTVGGLASAIANTQPTVQTNDETAVLPFTGVTMTDANPGNPVDTLTVTTTTSGNGTLTATKGGAVANGTFSVSGTAQQVTAALAGLQFTPLAHEVAPG